MLSTVYVLNTLHILSKFIHITTLLLSYSYISANLTQLKLTLEQATKAHMGSRGIAILFF